MSDRKTLLQVTYFQLFPRPALPFPGQISLNSAKHVSQRCACIRVPQTNPKFCFESLRSVPKWSKFLLTPLWRSLLWNTVSPTGLFLQSLQLPLLQFRLGCSFVPAGKKTHQSLKASFSRAEFHSNMQQKRLEACGVFILICVFRGNLNKSSRRRMYETAPANTKQPDVYTKTTAFF